MNKYIFLGLIFMGLSCHKTTLTEKRNIPSLKGFWYINNQYPFWNPSNTRSTDCIDEPLDKLLFFDSISPVKYLVYQANSANQGIYKNLYSILSFDTLNFSVSIIYGKDSAQNYACFVNFYKMDLDYDTSLQNIKGQVGAKSKWDCVNLPGDSFQGNTIWIKVQ